MIPRSRQFATIIGCVNCFLCLGGLQSHLRSTFRIFNPHTQRVDISLLNLEGQEVAKVFSGEFGEGYQVIPNNVEPSTLARGLYLLQVRYGEGEMVRKVVIE